MALEVGRVDRDRLDAARRDVGNEVHDAVDEQHRKTMREQCHDCSHLERFYRVTQQRAQPYFFAGCCAGGVLLTRCRALFMRASTSFVTSSDCAMASVASRSEERRCGTGWVSRGRER